MSYVRNAALLMPILALVSIPLPAAPPQQSQSQLVKATVDAVVLVVVNDGAGKPVAEGSGFIVSGDGKIVTNHHVIEGAKSLTVKLNNGAFFSVDGVLADDPDHDLAIIKVPGKNLAFLSLADIDRVAVGDHVIAIGSPLGLENSVSDGIVSGFRDDGTGKSWIQTTAPASHGNSGGPLLVMDGKVAGVVTWKASQGENLNFAVPSKFISSLLAGSPAHPITVAAKSDSAKTTVGEKIWTSLVSGRDFKVRTDGDYIYTELILPPALQSTTAFLRVELKKSGDKWTGTARSYLPYPYKSSYSDYWRTGQRVGTENVNWCKFELEYEIDKISDTRIEGKSQGFNSVDAKKCHGGKLEWKDFAWIPK